jgi:hypothetical protein
MTCYYKPKFTIGETEQDTSFLGIAHLYRYAVDIINEACKRFGADKAIKVLDSAWCHLNEFDEKSLGLKIISERGIEPTAGDLMFLKRVIEAEKSIENAKQLFVEALHEEN